MRFGHELIINLLTSRIFWRPIAVRFFRRIFDGAAQGDHAVAGDDLGVVRTGWQRFQVSDAQLPERGVQSDVFS
jgi:hypothetical protein